MRKKGCCLSGCSRHSTSNRPIKKKKGGKGKGDVELFFFFFFSSGRGSLGSLFNRKLHRAPERHTWISGSGYIQHTSDPIHTQHIQLVMFVICCAVDTEKLLIFNFDFKSIVSKSLHIKSETFFSYLRVGWRCYDNRHFFINFPIYLSPYLILPGEIERDKSQAPSSSSFLLLSSCCFITEKKIKINKKRRREKVSTLLSPSTTNSPSTNNERSNI